MSVLSGKSHVFAFCSLLPVPYVLLFSMSVEKKKKKREGIYNEQGNKGTGGTGLKMYNESVKT